MKMLSLFNKKGFVGIIGLVIAVVVLCVLALFVYKAYFKTGNPPGESLFLQPLKEGQRYETPVDSAKRELDNIKQRINTRETELFGDK